MHVCLAQMCTSIALTAASVTIDIEKRVVNVSENQ